MSIPHLAFLERIGLWFRLRKALRVEKVRVRWDDLTREFNLSESAWRRLWRGVGCKAASAARVRRFLKKWGDKYTFTAKGVLFNSPVVAAEVIDLSVLTVLLEQLPCPLGLSQSEWRYLVTEAAGSSDPRRLQLLFDEESRRRILMWAGFDSSDKREADAGIRSGTTAGQQLRAVCGLPKPPQGASGELAVIVYTLDRSVSCHTPSLAARLCSNPRSEFVPGEVDDDGAVPARVTGGYTGLTPRRFVVHRTLPSKNLKKIRVIR